METLDPNLSKPGECSDSVSGCQALWVLDPGPWRILGVITLQLSTQQLTDTSGTGVHEAQLGDKLCPRALIGRPLRRLISPQTPL